jgi:adenylate cyclase
MIELEKTYLANELPDGLKDCKFKEIIDIYIPKSSEHPKLRLRKNGAKYELTKKEPVNDGDASEQREQTIILTQTEFNALNQQIEGKRVRKLRYYYKYDGIIAEFDIFQDLLKGLVVVDFEFKTIEEKNNFKMPKFCLTDITQEVFVAGGMVCGKSYEDIKNNLEEFNYKKLFIN